MHCIKHHTQIRQTIIWTVHHTESTKCKVAFKFVSGQQLILWTDKYTRMLKLHIQAIINNSIPYKTYERKNAIKFDKIGKKMMISKNLHLGQHIIGFKILKIIKILKQKYELNLNCTGNIQNEYSAKSK